MTLDDILACRVSVRKFDPSRKLPDGTVETLVSAAMLAPSWKNSQTPRYHAVLTKDMFSKLLDCLGPRNAQNAADASAMIVTTFVKDIAGFNREGKPDNELGNGWGIYDAGLADSVLLLKAAELGVDSLVMGIRDAQAISRTLSLPENEVVLSVIALGYRTTDPARPSRKPLDEILKIY